MTHNIPVNQNLVDMEYAVRGPIPLRAMDLQKEGRTIYACNIGNPQALEQKPISFYRQVIALLESSNIKRERNLTKLAKNNSDLFKESGINVQNKINVAKKLNFGKANLVVAVPDPWIDVQTIADLEEIAFEFRDIKKKRIRVATKYPNLTQDFLFSKGVTQFRLVESLGATEAYPFTGSAELITDITSTGETLKANNLRILKDGEILKSEACLLTSKKNVKKKRLNNLIKLLSK